MIPFFKSQSKFSIVLCLLIIFIGCKTNDIEERDLAGTYQSKEYSQFEIGWGQYISKNKFTSGSSLDLKADSTFYYQSCGNIIKGDWSIKRDSLLLLVKSNRWRDDSLHIHSFNGKQPEIPDEPVVYHIDGKMLWSKEKDVVKLNGKTYDSVEELVKTEN